MMSSAADNASETIGHETEVPVGRPETALPAIPDHEVIQKIGDGAYGEVWLVRNVMGTYRAAKVVRRRSFDHESPYEREFSGIRRFEPISRSHTSQVDILQVGRDEEAGYFYYVMEIADPVDLESDRREQLRRDESDSRTTGTPVAQADIRPETYLPNTLKAELSRRGRLPLDDCLSIGAALATALQHLHGHGLIHRDIKPTNIVFVNGIPKLADIGLVTETGEDVTFVGTKGYIPPEGPGSPAGDIYSLGKVLYEIVTGKGPLSYPAIPSSIEQGEKFLGLNDIILCACADNPNQRYENAVGLREALETLQTGGAVERIIAEPTNAPPNSLAVLPFVNMSTDQENEFLADGITEDLISALSRLSELHVPASTSSFAFKRKGLDIREVGKQLNVSAIVEGSVRKSGKRLRITAQLVKVSDGFHLWSDRFDRELRDVFEIQDDITRSILHALELELDLRPETTLVKPQTDNPLAYQLYLQGREHWNERGLGLEKALRYFELALIEDPDYPLALTGLADTQVLRAFYAMAPGQQLLPQIQTVIRRALQLDPNVAEAHNSRGMLRLVFDRDYVASEETFRRAIEINANYVPAHYWYGLLLAAMGRENDALEQHQRAVELDPLGPVTHSMLAWHHLLHLQLEQAIESASRSLELRSDWVIAKWVIGQALCLLGEHEGGIGELEEALDISQRNSLLLATLAWAHANAGQTDEARALLDELTTPQHAALAPKVFIAITRAAMGERDRARELVEAAWREGEVWIVWMATPFGARDFSDHPEATELFRRITASANRSE